MDKFINDFAKKYIYVYEQQTHPMYLKNNMNLYVEIYNYGISNGFINTYNKYNELFNINSHEYIIFAYMNNDNNKYFTNDEEMYIKSNFINGKDFNEYINKLFNDYKFYTDNYIKIGKRILDIEDELNKMNNIPYEITEKFHSLDYKITNIKTGENLSENDILEIFNSFKINKKIPIIIYINNKGKKYFKVSKKYFNNDLMKNEIYPNNSVIFITQEQVIVFNIETSGCEIKIDTKKSNMNTILWLENNFNLKVLFPDFNFEQIQKKDKIICDVLFKIKITQELLYKTIMLNKFANLFLNPEENHSSPWFLKTQSYIISFKDYNETMIIFENDMEMNDLLKISLLYDVRINVSFSKNIQNEGLFLSLSTDNENKLESFLYKFSKILSLFNGEEINIKSNDDFHTKSSSIIKNSGILDINILKSENIQQPSRICQLSYTPMIINEDEKNYWSIFSGGRKPGYFPPLKNGNKNDGQIRKLLVCPFDSHPVLYLKEAGTSDNPIYYPCCKKSAYDYDKDASNKYYGIEKEEILINLNKTRSIITDKQLTNGNKGEIDSILSLFLKQGLNNDNIIFNRIGISADLNSFIKSIYYGITYDIINSNVINSIEMDIEIIRKQLAGILPYNNDKILDINIYKQELYDYDNETIRNMILNKDQFIDPYLFYRGLEEIFNINIYVFTKSQDINTSYPISYEQEKSKNPFLEIPRCKNLHIRNKVNRPIMILYKNYGNIKSITQIPNCELIYMNNDNDKDKKFYFNDAKFNDYMYNYLKNITHPIEFEKIYNDIKSYDDPFDTNWIESIVYNQTLGKLIGQEINSYGKCISLIYENFKLGIPDSQPLNLPNNTKNKNVSLCDIMNAFEFNNNIIEKQYVWIPYNGKDKGIKIYYDDNKKEIRNILLSVDNLINEKNKISLLMQIINYLWRSDNESFIEWWNRYSIINNSSIFICVPSPKFSCNNRMFPKGNNFFERIRGFILWWPFFFYHCKIHVSKELNDRIINYFLHEESLTKGLDNTNIIISPPRFVNNLIFTKNDFKSNNDIIFNNEKIFKDWINFVEGKKYTKDSMKNMNIINNKITIRMSEINEPYLFKDTYGKIYIIQNILKTSNSYIHSLKLAVYWKDNKKNPGSNYSNNNDLDEYKKYKYVIYTINTENELIIIDNKTDGTNDYFQLLTYGNMKYAAMLPLL